MSQRDLFTDQATPANCQQLSKSAAVDSSHKNPFATILVLRCQKCKSTQSVDVTLEHPPHNGQSVRRDCARCGWTLGFPVWYGEKTEATE